MRPPDDAIAREVAQLLRRCLEDGYPVEIEGLGVFRRDPSGRIRFLPELRPKVFIAYADEDYAAAERLYHDLAEHGFDPWLDKKRLLPGQNWPRSIERSIEISDFFIACFSRHGVGKRGFFQSELRHALECAARRPLDEVFFIPVRLEECRVPVQIANRIQYVDLFPHWERGLRRILSVMRKAGSGNSEQAA